MGLVAGVLGPSTLVTALAYYFAWRREEAFAGYFGIDPGLLGFTTSEYLLRSVDALVVPITALMLAVFAVLAVRVVIGPRTESLYVPLVAGAAGLLALLVGLALALGHPVTSRAIYLQALALGVGALLIVFALARWPGAESGAVAALTLVGVAVAIVSLFWATAEYADSRGLRLARQLAADVRVNPGAVIFSKVDLGIDTKGPGSGARRDCEAIQVTRSKGSAYPFEYRGFTLLVHSAGRYFLTATETFGHWDPRFDSVFVLDDDANIRVQLERGVEYHDKEAESTFAGRPAFTC